MKNQDSNLKRFYRLNILLFIINIAVLVIWLVTTESRFIDKKMKINSNEFLQEELKLNEAQFDSIISLDKINFLHYQRVLRKLSENRKKLLAEVLKAEPDKAEIKELTRIIGHLNTALNRQTVNHLFNIKKVCNEDQQEKLRILFGDILEVNEYVE